MHKKYLQVVVGGFFSVALIGFVDTAIGATITFSTGEFNSSEWYSVIKPGSSGAGIAYTQSSGGNPGAYRRVSLSVDPYEFVLNSQLWSIANFTPAIQGSIISASLTYDVTRVYTSNGGATQIAKGISIKQDNTIYLYDLGVATTKPPNWTNVFVPDLMPLFPGINWSNGNTITFGFYDSVGTSGTGFTLDGGYDNFSVTVNSVPAPATIFLFGSGVISLIGKRIKRKNNKSI